MRTLRNALIIVVLCAAVGGAIAYLGIRNDGLAADRPPGRVETAIARRLVVLSVPAAARTRANPQGSGGDTWKIGADHFAEHCVICHGADGRGGSALGPNMYPPVPDLSSSAIQGMSDGALFAVISHGVRWTGMPAFRSEHSDEELWALVSFVRHVPQLPPSGVDDDDHHGDHGADGPDTVAMDGTTFTPAVLTVHVGDTVTWVNRDPFPHDVTSPAAGLASGTLESDHRWTFRATQPGTYAYVCTLHPGMQGRLIVQP